jgi:CSLREA domain-containing protein
MVDTNIIGTTRRAFGFGLAVMVAFLVVLLAPSPAHAITLTVNSTADPGTGGCNSTECTLREAINVSNGLPPPRLSRSASPTPMSTATPRPTSVLSPPVRSFRP